MLAGQYVHLLCTPSAGPAGGKARRLVCKLEFLQSSTNGLANNHSSNTTCCEQPTSIRIPKPPFSELRVQAPDLSRQSLWLIEGRHLVSRASIRTNSQLRGNISRRPTIGEPSDFRRVIPEAERIGDFQPLKLSIHLPGNELSTLPGFRDTWEEESGLTQPSQALVRPRLDSTLSRPSTAFSIPRKPVPARRTLSVDTTCCNTDDDRCHHSTSCDSASQMLQRPVYTTTQSTQDFLDSLEARLPKLPEPSRVRAGSEPVFPLRRRASDQNLRLRNHIEEREQVERQLADCNTIVEEIRGSADRRLSSNVTQPFSILPPTKAMNSRPTATLLRRSTAPQILTPAAKPPISATKDTRCSDHFDLPIENPTNVINDTNVEPVFNLPSTRSRISQWLLRSFAIPVSATTSDNSAQDIPFYQCRSFFDDRASSLSSLDSVSDAGELGSPWTTPRSLPSGKQYSPAPNQPTIPARGESSGTEETAWLVM